MKYQNTFKLFVFVTLALLETSLAFASGGPQFLQGGNQLKTDLISLLTPIFGIGLLGVGGFALMGKLHWAWLGAAVVGAILIFANDQVVSWIKGLFM